MDTCTCCGAPTDHAETHHHNHRKGDNFPDNLRAVDRRHHMAHHENEAATEGYARRRYGPSQSPGVGP